MSKKRIGLVIFLWDTAWKAVAVIAAVRNRQYKWIAPLIAVNSVGILPILYLFRFSKQQDGEEEEPEYAWG